MSTQHVPSNPNAVELVPYQNGMQLGQGFNTFIEARRVDNAVIVTDQKPPSTGFTKTYTSEEIDTYEKLATSLNVSAGAAISGYGASQSVDFAYLNKNEFESSMKTFQVRVECEYQASSGMKYSFNPIEANDKNDKYGDRYISDFIHGGHFYARVSIFTENKSSFTEISEATKTAFTMYGVTGEVTQEVKNAVDKINKLSTVKIVINETSATNNGNSVRVKETFATDLLAVKNMADEFYKAVDAGKHNYIRFALLGQYTTLPDFNSYFQPLDYTEAKKRSWELFNDFMDYISMEKLIKDIPANQYKSGQAALTNFERERLDQIEIFRAKIGVITGDPDDARTPGTHKDPEIFHLEVLSGVKMLTYIAQRIYTPDGNYTEVALQSLTSGAEKMFEFNALDFENVGGSVVISFGQKVENGNQMYVCLIGARAGLGSYADWREQSHFWVFPDAVKSFASQKLSLSKLDTKQYLRIAKGAAHQPDIKPMFDFFVV
ncbi:hypothetical protein BTUL_0289g00010 [Botrytis tulipae]|uniref:MACPF domain-containing protein n=1 Tax=Botrytis tulipae TaxID=87230 RepID=A0A4Z1E804_9HELO|nr:hypothetical protein BTUL_0289g00010 [Botrytis tulipae]